MSESEKRNIYWKPIFGSTFSYSKPTGVFPEYNRVSHMVLVHRTTTETSVCSLFPLVWKFEYSKFEFERCVVLHKWCPTVRVNVCLGYILFLVRKSLKKNDFLQINYFFRFWHNRGSFLRICFKCEERFCVIASEKQQFCRREGKKFIAPKAYFRWGGCMS